MATRNMETTLISARDLNNAGMFAKTKPYAVAWISTDLKNRLWTPVDEENGTNPTWNQVMNFTLDEAALQQGRLLLEVEIYNDSTFGEKEIGRISISLKEFLKPADNNKVASDSPQFVSYQVRKPNGKPKGSLNLSVRLAEKVDFKPQQQSREAEKVDFKPQQQSREVVTESYEAVKEPVVADPVYESVVSSPPATNQYPPQSYAPQAEYDQPPPPPHHQGYPPPPPHHQGYPPPPPHHSGYPPPPPPPHHSGYPPPPPPPHHRGYPPPPPHHPGYPPPPPPPHHPGYPLY